MQLSCPSAWAFYHSDGSSHHGAWLRGGDLCRSWFLESLYMFKSSRIQWPPEAPPKGLAKLEPSIVSHSIIVISRMERQNSEGYDCFSMKCRPYHFSSSSSWIPKVKENLMRFMSFFWYISNGRRYHLMSLMGKKIHSALNGTLDLDHSTHGHLKAQHLLTMRKKI